MITMIAGRCMAWPAVAVVQLIVAGQRGPGRHTFEHGLADEGARR
jgi:hypothetical protein